MRPGGLIVAMLIAASGWALAQAEPPAATPTLTPLEAARNADFARFEKAADHTADGSRAYSLFSQQNAGRQGGNIGLYLLVRPDGSGQLFGSVHQPVELDAAAVAPVEAAVKAAGFPNLPPSGSAICTDGAYSGFEAAMGGQHIHIANPPCVFFNDRVEAAVQQLLKLAETHGGVYAPYDIPRLPVAVTVFANHH